MVHYNPQNATREYTGTDEEHLRPFKGVSFSDPSKVTNLEIVDSALMWMADERLANGNVVYVEGIEESLNPFLYQSTESEPHPPSEQYKTSLLSATQEKEILFRNHRGWNISDLQVYPIADEYLLQELGESHKILIHNL